MAPGMAVRSPKERKHPTCEQMTLAQGQVGEKGNIFSLPHLTRVWEQRGAQDMGEWELCSWKHFLFNG